MRYTIEPVSNTWNDFDRAFKDLTRGFFEPTTVPERTDFSPRVEVFDNGDYYGLSLDLPGLALENLDIEADAENLVLSGERKKIERKEATGSFYTEKIYGKFKRTIRLPKNAIGTDIEAHFENGVLEIKVPKTAQSMPRKIQINKPE